MSDRRRKPLVRYGFALVAVAGAIGPFFVPGVGLAAVSLEYLAIFLSAWFGGTGPGLLATALTTAFSIWLAAQAPRPRYLAFVIAIGLLAAGGVVICFVVRSMDRARRRAEENAIEADRQSERLRTTLRSIGDAVIVADQAGRVVSLNPVAESLTGWTEEEAAGRRLSEVFHVEGGESAGAGSDSTLRTFRNWGLGGLAGHSALVARDGSRRPIDETAATIRGADGSVRGAVLVFRDVSDRREAERRLTAAEARFRAFMDHSPVVAYIKDDYGRYVWGNAAWGRLHPGGAESALGKTDFELWPAETASRFREGDRLALESETPTQVDEPSVAHDGTASQWISLKFRIGDGEPPLIGGISVDGTERIVAERALRDSEERYRTLFDANPLPMWVYDVETLGFLAVNSAAVRRYGYTREDFLAMRITDIRPAEDIPKLRARVAVVRDTTYLAETTWRHLTKDGTMLDVEITSHAIEFEGRRARLVLAHDVTDRRRAEEGLRINRERLDLALDAAELGVWYGDIPVTSFVMNERARAHHGLGPDEEATTELLTERLHPDDRERTTQAFQSAIDGGGTYDVVYRVAAADGDERWVRSIGRAFPDETGRVARFDGVTIDVTSQKEAEARLREATEAAVEANRAKDRFLAVLGHELRTPLTPVLAAVSTLLDAPTRPGRTPPEWSQEQIRETLAMIRRNVELETRLIGDLLDVARVQRGQLKLIREPVNVHRAIREAVDICRDEILVSGLDVRFALGAASYHVQADHARFLQIAWNLIHNAAKFSPPGARLVIRTSNAPGADGRDRVLVEFEDNGTGMAPDILERIFDPFEQGDTPARRRIGGLGLGLAISRSIAEAHGGTLTASSPGPGLGSTFRIELDAVARPEPAAPPASPPDGAPPAPALRVLLVEDNADTLRYLATLLHHRGYRVQTATRLSEAEQAVASSTFDLLISDIELPDGSGLDLMRSLRGKVVGVAVSGFGSDSDIELSLDAGFAVHLTKPLDFARLEAAIRDALAIPAA